MEQIPGKKVIFIMDEYTLEIEKEYQKQSKERNEPIPNRSDILRSLYRDYIQKRTIATESK